MKINTTYFKLKERYIYGSSRVGVRNSDLDVLPLPDKNFSMTTVHYSIGSRMYELSNHLGNVLSVISDKVIPVFSSSTVISEMRADIRVAQDYSPFGVTLDGRDFVVSERYRYGFNGMESDDEVKGEKNSYTTEFRQYDPRLGRWLSIDPMYAKFPWQSPYVAFDNNPVLLRDPKGLAAEGGGDDKSKKLKQNKDGTRSADNGDGTSTYDAPGHQTVIIPNNAKILGTFQDVDGNKKMNIGNKEVQASVGDVYRFEVNGTSYGAKFDEKGKFNGYWDAKGNKYKAPNNVPAQNAPKIRLYAEIETAIIENSYGANVTKGFGVRLKLGEQTSLGVHTDSENGTYMMEKNNQPTKLGFEAGWYSFGGEYNYLVNPDNTTTHQVGVTFFLFERAEYEYSNGKQKIFVGLNPSASGALGVGACISGKFGLLLSF